MTNVKKLVLLFSALLTSAAVFSQQSQAGYVTLGSSPAGTGSFLFCQFQTGNVTLTLETPPTGASVTATVKINGGQSTSVCAGGGCSPQSVTLTNVAAGSYTVSYSMSSSFNSFSFEESLTAGFSLGTIPTPNASFSYSGNVCGSQTISYTTSPPTCVNWYWQTSSTGTDLSNGTNSLTVSSSGTYYLRPYYSGTSAWGTAQATNNITYNMIPAGYQVGLTGNSVFCSGATAPSVTLSGSQTGVNYQLLNNSSPAGQPVTGTGGVLTWANQSTAGAYTISASTATCSAAMSQQVVVTVNATPPAPTISGNNRFGAGALTLIASGGGTNANYTWANSSGTLYSGANYPTPSFSSSVSGYCSVYATNPNGPCTGPSTQVNVNIFSVPSISSTNSRVYMGSTTTMDAGSGYDSYTWSGPFTGNAETLTTSLPGSYTVTVTKSGLSATATYTIYSQMNGNNSNYVLTTTLLTDGIKNVALLPSLTVSQASQTVQYFDGLARPLQNVTTQGSPSKLDLVNPVAYDSYGREPKKYLPFTSGNDGSYKGDPLGALAANYTTSSQYVYYNNGTTDKIIDDTRPFAETVFEPSPLNRPSEQFGSGQNWYDNNKSTNIQYLVNTAMDVFQFAYDPVSGSLGLGSGSLAYYPTAQLTANQTSDENGNSVIQYVDKLGRTVCKKVQYGSGSTGTLYASTYYLYDDLGNLVLVLPPEAIRNIH